MNAPDVRTAAAELTRRTRERQGMPSTIEDELALARVVALLGGGGGREPPNDDGRRVNGARQTDREVVRGER